LASLEKFNGVIVIGSGPTAASAAWPLVHAGINVLMLEAGNQITNNLTSDRPDLKDLRIAGSDSISLFRSGIKNSAFSENSFISPKLRLTAPPNLLQDFKLINRCELHGFNPIGALCEGGLSNFWGGSCAEWSKDELTDAIDFNQMQISYKNISRRIGLSGSLVDSMSSYLGSASNIDSELILSPMAENFLSKYNRQESDNFLLGRAKLAVLSKKKENRHSCLYCKSCMYGCHIRAIYNSSFDIEKLRKFRNFDLRHNSIVTSISKSDNNYIVELDNGKKIQTSCLVLAAGVISTTRLFLKYKHFYNKQIRILTNPAFSFSLFMPSMLGKPLPEKGFSLAQLAFASNLEEVNLKLFGMIYDADSFPVSDLISHSPLTANASRKLFRSALSSLSIGMGYLPGAFSNSHIYLSRNHKLHIKSDPIYNIDLYKKFIRKNLFEHFMRLGAFLLPGTLRFFEPGSEVHYAGTLPIGKYLNADCSIIGEHNFYIADSSSLPFLSEKPHTYTAMANADRIGRAIVEKLS
jgi:hypothetical protein